MILEVIRALQEAYEKVGDIPVYVTNKDSSELHPANSLYVCESCDIDTPILVIDGFVIEESQDESDSE